MKTYIKKIIFLYAIICLSILFVFTTNAHSGKTDSNGGHHDNTGGGYHYHHGYPAHQHENGECPYDMKDNTNDNENKASQTEAKTKSKYTVGQIIGLIICLPFISYLLACIPSSIIYLLLFFVWLKTDSDFTHNAWKWSTIIFTIIISIVLFCNLVF